MVDSGSESLRVWVRIGAVRGVAAWAAYGIVECMFSSVLLNLFAARTAHSLLNNGFTLALFGLFLSGGALLGALSGAALHAASPWLSCLRRSSSTAVMSSVASFTVIVALAANCVVSGALPRKTLVGFLAVATTLTAGLAWTASSVLRYRRLRPVFNAWTVSSILLGLISIVSRLDSRVARAAAAAAWIVSVLVVSMLSFLVARRVRLELGRAPAARPSPRGTLVAVAVWIALFLPFSFWANRPPGLVAGELRGSRAEAALPNILLITLDTLRADHMSLYGYPRETTPNLDELSRGATLYTRAVSAGDVTLSSHASIFTGTYALKHGVHFEPPDHTWGRHLPERFRSMAEILAARGYATAAVVSNYAWLGERFSLDRGFQYHDSRRAVTFLHQPDRAFYLRHWIYRVLRDRVSREAFEPRYHRAEAINREVYPLLDRLRRLGTPFFLFVNYLDPHAPYFPPHPFDMRFEGKIAGFGSQQFERLKEVVMRRERSVTDEERANLVSQYDGEIAYLDHHFGKLLRRLEELEMYDDLLIVVTSDHGESFGHRQLIEHGVSVYQDQVHVPLIVKYPRQREPSVVDEQVSHVDILPTVLALTGTPLPRYLDGRNLLQVEARTSRAVFSESFRNRYFSGTSRLDRVERAIVQDAYKFIWSSNGKRELYDLSVDPDEENDLGLSMSGRLSDLESLMDSWTKIVKAERASDVDDPTELDEETLDALRALGYID